VGFEREIVSTNEIGLEGMAVGGQIVQQMAKQNEITDASGVLQGRLLFTQRAEPTEQMRIPAQLGELTNLRESGLEISDETARDSSIAVYRLGS